MSENLTHAEVVARLRERIAEDRAFIAGSRTPMLIARHRLDTDEAALRLLEQQEKLREAAAKLCSKYAAEARDDDGRLRWAWTDHACAECISEHYGGYAEFNSELVRVGFRCAFHALRAALAETEE